MTRSTDPDLNLPIIDLAAAEADVIRQVACACEAWGFFQVGMAWTRP